MAAIPLPRSAGSNRCRFRPAHLGSVLSLYPVLRGTLDWALGAAGIALIVTIAGTTPRTRAGLNAVRSHTALAFVFNAS